MITKPITIKKTWEKFLLSSVQASFLQSWNWGRFHQSIGHQIIRLGFYRQKKLIGICLLIKIKAKRGHYFECPAGPVIDWNDQNTVKQTFQIIKKIAQRESVSFVRCRPNILINKINLKKYGLVKAPMHLHAETTWVLDLDQSLENLLKNMRKNTRYSIKKALKLKLKVTQSIDVKDVGLLYKLQMDTVNRHHFIPFSKQYFLKQLKAFALDKQIQLFKVIYKGQVLVISFIIFYGSEAVYHYSGSSSEFRNIPASYLLQWQAILTAKKKGFKHYNFWGIAPTDNPRHRFSGVTLFKKGFGGHRVDYLPAHDLPIKQSYWLTYIFETLRRRLRHL